MKKKHIKSLKKMNFTTEMRCKIAPDWEQPALLTFWDGRWFVNDGWFTEIASGKVSKKGMKKLKKIFGLEAKYWKDKADDQ